MEKIIVLIDYNGLALGAVYMHEEGVILVDNLGRMVQKVPIKTTVKKAMEILLKNKINYVT